MTDFCGRFDTLAGSWLFMNCHRKLMTMLQAVFLAYMVVNKKTVNVGLAAVLIIATAVYKVLYVAHTHLSRRLFTFCASQYDSPLPGSV